MTRERKKCPLCGNLEGKKHAWFCRVRKIDGAWVGGHKAVDNAVTRAGDALLPFVEAMKRLDDGRK